MTVPFVHKEDRQQSIRPRIRYRDATADTAEAYVTKSGEIYSVPCFVTKDGQRAWLQMSKADWLKLARGEDVAVPGQQAEFNSCIEAHWPDPKTDEEIARRNQEMANLNAFFQAKLSTAYGPEQYFYPEQIKPLLACINGTHPGLLLQGSDAAQQMLRTIAERALNALDSEDEDKVCQRCRAEARKIKLKVIAILHDPAEQS